MMKAWRISFIIALLFASRTRACDEGSVRLVGGNRDYEGRVEVCLEGEWGTVCDDVWDDNDASVACRQAGYCGQDALAFSGAYFGNGSGPIHLDNVECSGNETSLQECVHVEGEFHNCGHTEDASVRCKVCCEGDVRLEDGPTASEGRVSVCAGTPLQWGTVCNDNFDTVDATVVCKQLGYSRHNATVIVRFEGGSGEILMDDVRCRGSETSLLDCHHSTDNNCIHYEDVGVNCSETFLCSEGEIRLVDGDRVNSGRLEVCLNEDWTSVCSAGWTAHNTEVACREIGYAARAGLGTIATVPGDGNILQQQYSCSGSESRLQDCPAGAPVACSHTDDVTLQCANRMVCENGAVRLADGTEMSGRVEICVGEQWGTVCDDEFDGRDARVVCRQLGFSTLSENAVVLPQLYQNPGNAPIHLTGVNCSGTEQTLLSCPHSTSTFACVQFEDVQVSCQPFVCEDGDVRLADGPSEYEGRLDICDGERWGTVCDDGWYSDSDIVRVEDVSVACRQLGFSSDYEVLLPSGQYPAPSGSSILLDEVICDGDETSLLDCDHFKIGRHNCNHTEDVNLRCGQCEEYDVRLLDGASTSEGRVEVCAGGRWGTVCDRHWNTSAAVVACRQLGLPTAGSRALSGGIFPPNTPLPIVISGMDCGGNEISLADCQHLGSSALIGCSHNDDAGVRCSLAPPNGPRDLLVVAVTATTAEFSWTAPLPSADNSPVTGYRVECHSDQPSRYSTTQGTQADTVSTLSPYTDYLCCVRANSTVGYGQQTCVHLKTLEAAPSDPPQNISHTILDSRTVRLEWSPPNQPNGNISNYNIIWRDTQSNTETEMERLSLSYTVTNLHPYYIYEYTMSASTVGYGPYSTVTSVQMQEDVPSGPPQQLTVTTSQTTISLLWSPPPPSQQNGRITVYRVHLMGSGNSADRMLETSNLSIIISSLVANSQYLVSVAARTSVGGYGPGTAYITASTDPPDISSPPHSVSVIVQDHEKLRVTWTQPPTSQLNGEIEGYRIRITETPTNRVWTDDTDDVMEYTITGLHPNYLYGVEVTVLTNEGLGLYSSPKTATTDPYYPNGAPEITSASVTTHTVTLSWTALPEDQWNGNLTGYAISSHSEGLVVEVPAHQLTITLEARPFTEYILSVAAVNSVGMGPFSDTTIVRTKEDAPTHKPINLEGSPVSSMAINIHWDPPPLEHHNGEIDNYTILCNETNTGWTWQTHVPAPVTSINITHLHPYYTYHCSVSAVTVGHGPFTTTISITTLEDAPGPPQNLREIERGSQYVAIAWELPVPSEQNGMIRSYLVHLAVHGAPSPPVIERVPASLTSLNVTALKPFTQYNIHVVAVTIAPGDSSSIISVITEQAPPSVAPQSVVVVAASPDTLNISWQPLPATHLNGILTGYLVTLYEQETRNSSDINSLETHLTVEGLHPHYTYNVSVAAATEAGLGPHSYPHLQQLPQAPPSQPPSQLVVAEVSARSAVLEWSAPPTKHHNGVIINYVLYLESEDGTIYSPLMTPGSKNTTIVRSLQPNTSYSCSVAAVTVGAGPRSMSVRFTTKTEPPGAVQNLTARAKSCHTVLVSWDHPNCSAVNNYNIIFTDNGTYAEEGSTRATHFPVDGLEPDTLYRFIVTPVNDDLRRGPEASVSERTLSEEISEPPLNIRQEFVTPRVLNISWSPPEPICSITGYVINITDFSTGHLSHNFTTENSISLTLHPYYYYNYSIAALNGGQRGPFSTVIHIQMPQDVPSAEPLHFIATNEEPGTVVLSWEPPPTEHWNGEITGYVLQTIDLQTNEVTAANTNDTNMTETGLKLHHNYNFTVAATTSIGPGPLASATILTLSHAEAPPPAVGEASRISASQIKLSWQPGDSDSLITHYTVKYYPLTSPGTLPQAREVLAMFVTTNATEVVISDLDPVTSYSLAVAANNAAGIGSYSEEITVGLFENCHFQLFLSGGSFRCKDWVTTHIETKMENLLIQLTTALESKCECGLSPEFLSLNEPDCISSHTNWLIVSGLIVSTEKANCTDIMLHLEEWAGSESELTVEGIILMTVQECPVYWEDGDPIVCDGETTTEPSPPSDSQFQLFSVVIAAVAAVVVVVAIAVVCILVVRHRRKRATTVRLSQGDRTEAHNAAAIAKGIEDIYDIPDMIRVYEPIPDFRPQPPAQPPPPLFPPNDLATATTTFSEPNPYEVKPRLGTSRPLEPSARASDYIEEYETAMNIAPEIEEGDKQDLGLEEQDTTLDQYARLRVDFNKDLPASYEHASTLTFLAEQQRVSSNQPSPHYQPLMIAAKAGGKDQAYVALDVRQESSNTNKGEHRIAGNASGVMSGGAVGAREASDQSYNKLEHPGPGVHTRPVPEPALSGTEDTACYQPLLVTRPDLAYTTLTIPAAQPEDKQDSASAIPAIEGEEASEEEATSTQLETDADGYARLTAIRN